MQVEVLSIVGQRAIEIAQATRSQQGSSQRTALTPTRAVGSPSAFCYPLATPHIYSPVTRPPSTNRSFQASIERARAAASQLQETYTPTDNPGFDFTGLDIDQLFQNTARELNFDAVPASEAPTSTPSAPVSTPAESQCQADLHVSRPNPFFQTLFQNSLFGGGVSGILLAANLKKARTAEEGTAQEAEPLPLLRVIGPANCVSLLTAEQEIAILNQLHRLSRDVVTNEAVALSNTTREGQSSGLNQRLSWLLPAQLPEGVVSEAIIPLSRELSSSQVAGHAHPVITHTVIDLRELSDQIVQFINQVQRSQEGVLVPRGTLRNQVQQLQLADRVEATGTALIRSSGETFPPRLNQEILRGCLQELAQRVRDLASAGTVIFQVNENTQILGQMLGIDISQFETNHALEHENTSLLLDAEERSVRDQAELGQPAALTSNAHRAQTSTSSGQNFGVEEATEVDQAEVNRINAMSDIQLLGLSQSDEANKLQLLTAVRVSNIQLSALLQVLPNSKLSHVANNQVKFLLLEQIPFLRSEQLAHLPEERLNQLPALQLLRLPRESRESLSPKLKIVTLAFTLYQVALAAIAILRVSLGTFDTEFVKNLTSSRVTEFCFEQENKGHEQLDLTKNVVYSYWNKTPLVEISLDDNLKSKKFISLTA